MKLRLPNVQVRSSCNDSLAPLASEPLDSPLHQCFFTLEHAEHEQHCSAALGIDFCMLAPFGILSPHLGMCPTGLLLVPLPFGHQAGGHPVGQLLAPHRRAEELVPAVSWSHPFLAVLLPPVKSC